MSHKEFSVAVAESPRKILSGCDMCSTNEVDCTLEGSCLCAAVHYNGGPGFLEYDERADTLSIVKLRNAGQAPTVVGISMNMVINVEHAKERAERQAVRQCDDAVRVAEYERETGCSSCLSNSFCRPRKCEQASSTTLMTAESCSQDNHFYLHYVVARGSNRHSLCTAEFSYDGSVKSRGDVERLVSALLRRIYPDGLRHIIVFISPKSGFGKGEEIFAVDVQPILHMSRHMVEVHVMSRAHECEDYVANLQNDLSRHHVIAVIGGDGMVHEAVNGLHRRKCALLHQYRKGVAKGGSSPPGSRQSFPDAPCVGHKVSAGFLFDKEVCCAAGDRSSAGESASPAVLSPITRPCHADNPETGCGGLRASFADIGTNEVHKDANNGKFSEKATQFSLTPATDINAGMHPLVEALTKGWDAVLPQVATVPAGSACGLAKSMDVLTPLSSTLALVHSTSCHMDLMQMRFRQHNTLVEHHESQVSKRQRRRMEKKFSLYKLQHAHELQQLQDSQDGNAALSSSFLSDGTPIYNDALSMSLGCPAFTQRVAFMSLSIGVANDIDRGSERWRWMGNTRFAAYGAYTVIRGFDSHPVSLRYLPWTSHSGWSLQKLRASDVMPNSEEFPPCTMRDSCPHCATYQSECPLMQVGRRDGLSLPSDGAPIRDDEMTALAHRAIANCSTSELLGEEAVDFDDESMPWTTLQSNMSVLLVCSMRDVARDMMMAPASHLSDGGMDIVIGSCEDSGALGDRKKFLQMFLSLEKGGHVHLPFTQYIKARALEVSTDGGILMADGEVMPMGSVRVTKLRHGVRFLHGVKVVGDRE